MRKNALMKIVIRFYIFSLFLIISPAQDLNLLWNTFLGTSNIDFCTDIATDNSGNSYFTGYMNANWGNPIIPLHGTRYDIVVVKISSEGILIWNTFLGSLANDQGFGITVDRSGYIYVTGVSNGTWGNPVNAFVGGGEIFVAKLDGNGNLLANTFLGSMSSDRGDGITIDSLNNIIIGGDSLANWGSPIRNFSGGSDAFVAKLDPNLNLLWNTFLGSILSDYGYAISCDRSGNIYTAGQSNSNWGNPVRAFSGNSNEGFVAKLDGNGNLLWNTFLGSSLSDNIFSISTDDSGKTYVAGNSSATWGNPIRPYSAGFMDGFAAKLDTNGNLLWNTFLGSFSNDIILGSALNRYGDFFVGGSSSDTWGSPVHNISGIVDAFVAKLDTNGNLIRNTFLGSSGMESSMELAADRSGDILVSGVGSATWGSPIRNFSGNIDVFIAKLNVEKFYEVEVSTPSGGGSVARKYYRVKKGDNVTISIYPDEGYEIDEIVDNGKIMEVENPYILYDIDRDHDVKITFKKILYPPELSLTGVRKTDGAWIIKRDYIELNISMVEHESPMVVEEFLLYKNVSGVWIKMKSYETAGSYHYSEKYFKTGESVSYKLSAVAPDGSVIVETSVLTL